ncbi:MAG: bifunctional [glutamate--ammonia ligase]-adenylyl-L-tyrosine phosphorylase/[glutamate--ammonia-ligase] adenylyltransferase [Mariprofundales bacterium]|nr:bifunctional [glutamate--ammonia ligase]-adenylyl-L-tyrosine phosphorylase/[glutamate--ammonia-ligase] adenylyltransferase [Mariprofundales bacterium]
MPTPYLATLLRRAGLNRDALADNLAAASLPDGSAQWLPPCNPSNIAEAQHHLRHHFARSMSHIIWWELALHGDIAASWRAISRLADGLLGQALTMAETLLTPRYGHIAGGEYCIIGLGKLGGYELNLGSDVDLLSVWEATGESSGGRQTISAEEYYAHLTRMVIRLIDEPTEHGRVWPVDMRLRPGGATSPVAVSVDATIDHYLQFGQTWERAMLIKARPVAGSQRLGKALLSGIQPFVFKKYLDYTTVAALADMKRRIDGQTHANDIAPGFDVKRGIGGIREIEFMIQSRQLLHGARQPELRLTGSMAALQALQASNIINADEANAMRSAYRFWRRVEHAIQAQHGEQTQKLPKHFADYLQPRLQVENLTQTMQQHAAEIHRLFAHHVLPITELDGGTTDWLSPLPPALPETFSTSDTRRIHLALEALRQQLSRGLLPERSNTQVRRILARAMPVWCNDTNGMAALEAFVDMVRTISGRATWIDLLATHEGTLNWLIGVLSASRYVAQRIANNPSWLEWPLEQAMHEHDIDTIHQQLITLANDDPEQALADIGRLVDRGRLLAALAVDAHTADAATIGYWLARLADGATIAALRICCLQIGLEENFPLVALAMGKHGSEEMGFTSDLDMVFVLVCDDPKQEMAGRSISEQAQRLGRRIIQILTAAPPYGAGFAFDARLRPSGESGALVTTLRGFDDYQHHHAQTWEHQALCRARAIAVDGTVAVQVEQTVATILNLPREPKILASEVRTMRTKMEHHLASSNPAMIDLKQDAGGLVDIEFLAQFARLVFHISQRGSAQILTQIPATAPHLWQQHGPQLAQHYHDYRQIEIALRIELWRSLRKLPTSDEATEWETLRRHCRIHTPQELQRTMQETRTLFDTLLALAA